MKLIKLLIFLIILVLVLGAVTVVLIYFYTDTFKSNQEIFYKYFSEDQASKLIEIDSIDELINKTKKENNEQEIELTISESTDTKTIIDSQTVKFQNKIDITNKMVESNIIFKDDVNENIISMDFIRNEKTNLDEDGGYKDIYALKLENILDQYIAIENHGIKDFVQDLGMDNTNVKDKIEISNLTKDLIKNKPETIEPLTELYNILKNNTEKKNYSKLGKTKITLNGENTEANGYELNIKKNQLQPILEKSDNEIIKKLNENDLNLSVKIYLKDKSLVKCEAFIESINKIYSINIVREENSVYIRYNNSDSDLNYELNVSKKGSLDSGEVEFFGTITYELKGDKNTHGTIEFDAKFKFVDDLEITELTKENCAVLNEYEPNQVLNVLNYFIEKIYETEGVNESLLGKFLEKNEEKINAITSASTRANSEEIQTFNNRFIQYQGTITGINVKSLITIIETSNSTSDLQVILKLNEEEKPGNEVILLIEDNEFYSVTFEYDEQGYVNVINIA